MAEASCTRSLASTVGKNFIECSICCDSFDDPRALPCLHPFCSRCLENWAKECSDDGMVVLCPLCKKVYQIPEEEGIKGFPAHFFVADLRTTVQKSKQKHSTSGFCENHGEKQRYYCENCDCAACSDCGILDPTHRGHTFIRLKQIALQQSRSLGDLTRKVGDVKKMYESEVQQAQQVEQDLDQAADTEIKAIKEARDEFIQQVHGLVKAYEQEVYHKKEEKRKAVQQLQEKLQFDLVEITSSYELAKNIIDSGAHSDIISLYPSLSSSLQQLIQSQPSTVGNALSQIQLKPPPQQNKDDLSLLERLLWNKLHITASPSKHDQVSTQTTHLSKKLAVTANLSAATTNLSPRPFPTSTATPKSFPSLSASGKFKPTEKWESGHNPAPGSSESKPTHSSHPSLSSGFQPPLGNHLRKRWKKSGEVKTAPARYPHSISIHPNGDFAVTSHLAPVAVFSVNSNVIKGSPSGISDIAITPSNQYIIPVKRGSNEFYIYDIQGVLLRSIPTYDINSKPRTPSSVAVDSTGRIIVGLGYYNKHDKTVSIHQPDGTLISKFETISSPWQLTCTPDDRLIISFENNTLQMIDQSGLNASIIQPPPGIQSWEPWYVCCSKQGELFVSSTWGDPKSVYRYVYTYGEYKYLDCITTGWQPWGIALSADEKKLFVVDRMASVIKVFR